MYKPKTLIRTNPRDAMTEIGALYLLTTIAVVQLLSLNWLMALLVAPFVIGAALLGLLGLVNLLWVTMLGVDRLTAAVGIRKSPLT
jgi:hypothetical protein